jgi:hypothetical protein
MMMMMMMMMMIRKKRRDDDDDRDYKDDDDDLGGGVEKLYNCTGVCQATGRVSVFQPELAEIRRRLW